MYNKIMKAFVGLVAVLLLILGAYYAGKNSRAISQEEYVQEVIPTPVVSVPSPTTVKTPTVTSTPISAKLVSTKGWIVAENGTFRIKYPAEMFRSISGNNYIQLQWKNNTGSLMTNSPNFVIADSYSGGSRREWYLNQYSYYANEVVFTEKLLGKVSVLEARPKSEKSIRDILVANGNMLIDVMLQGADVNLTETIVSTLEFK